MPNCRKIRPVSGLLLLDKPSGLTANAALQRVKRLFAAKKAGHTGALDPLASGMLPICLGEATKFSQFLLEADKHYQVTARLGLRTDTADTEGTVIQQRLVTSTFSDIQQALANFQGIIQQTPSRYSALKYQGKPHYYYARRGIAVPDKIRQIEIYQISLDAYQDAELQLTIHCSKGTYIRTLIDDLGELLGCGAHVAALCRYHVADFSSDTMVTLEQLSMIASSRSSNSEPNFDALDQLLLPISSLLSQLPKWNITSEAARTLQQGRPLAMLTSCDGNIGQLVQLTVGTEHYLLGVGEYQQDTIVAKRLLAS
ncbi:MAG: tRNA pseudouridine(55) synthase TruB [Candidatus Symbiodolus clandestinus]